MDHENLTFPGTAMDLDPMDVSNTISLEDINVDAQDDSDDDWMDIDTTEPDFVPRFGAGEVPSTFEFDASKLTQAPLSVDVNKVSWREASASAPAPAPAPVPAPTPTPMDVDVEVDLMDVESDTDQDSAPQGHQNPIKSKGVEHPTANPGPIFGKSSLPINWALQSKWNTHTYQTGLEGSIWAKIAGGKNQERVSAEAEPHNIAKDVDWSTGPSSGLCPKCRKWKKSQKSRSRRSKRRANKGMGKQQCRRRGFRGSKQ